MVVVDQMVRCMFCDKNGFEEMSSVWEGHQLALTSRGFPACTKINLQDLASMDMNDSWFGKTGQFYRDVEKYRQN